MIKGTEVKTLEEVKIMLICDEIKFQIEKYKKENNK